MCINVLGLCSSVHICFEARAPVQFKSRSLCAKRPTNLVDVTCKCIYINK